MKQSGRTTGHRIAILTPSLAGQGAERKALYLAAGLLERGYNVDILLQRLICHYPDEVPDRARIFYESSRTDARTRVNLGRIGTTPHPLLSEPSPWWIRYPRIGMSRRLRRKQLRLLMSTRLPGWAASIAAYLDREHPRALLAMNVLSASAATMATQLSHHPVRVVATLHEPLNHRRLLVRARCSYPYADAVVGVSHGVSAEFAKIPNLTRSQLYVIYNPVFSEYLTRKSREPADHPWLDRAKTPVIIAIGKLIRRKDFATLLIAFARVRARRSARLIVLGEGRLRRSLLSLARRVGVAEHVDFAGFLENPYALLANADLFVLSSRNEALPTVLIEAMACGCPVVSTDCPFGPREILENGRYGALVPVGQPEALAAAMARTLDQPPQRTVLRKRASFFSAERAVNQYEKLLLGNHRHQSLQEAFVGADGEKP